MTEQINKAPGGATHQYTTTDWYHEAEDGLYFWDGKWSKSHFSSVAEMAKTRVMGIVEAIPALPAKPAEDDLTWLARNVSHWPHIISGLPNGAAHSVQCTAIVVDGKNVEWKALTPADGIKCFSKQQWLARRTVLQNKPSWDDAPEWAELLAQHSIGRWTWYEEEPCHDDNGFWVDGGACQCAGKTGEVLCDWRDTLEWRPQVEAEITDPFDPEFRPEPSPSGLAVEIISTLEKTPSYFSSNELMSIHSLIGDELNKRDTAVCGGQKYLDATWFERGELPPVGCVCLYALSENYKPVKVEITARTKLGVCFAEVGGSGEGYVSKTAGLNRFRPLQTERERVASELVDVMMAVPVSELKTGSEHAMDMALAIYDHLHKEQEGTK